MGVGRKLPYKRIPFQESASFAMAGFKKFPEVRVTDSLIDSFNSEINADFGFQLA